ncbi:MAG: hypothetical protein ABIK65_13350 [Candidatus Eisenbacteria bacterium]
MSLFSMPLKHSVLLLLALTLISLFATSVIAADPCKILTVSESYAKIDCGLLDSIHEGDTISVKRISDAELVQIARAVVVGTRDATAAIKILSLEPGAQSVVPGDFAFPVAKRGAGVEKDIVDSLLDDEPNSSPPEVPLPPSPPPTEPIHSPPPRHPTRFAMGGQVGLMKSPGEDGTPFAMESLFGLVTQTGFLGFGVGYQIWPNGSMSPIYLHNRLTFGGSAKVRPFIGSDLGYSFGTIKGVSGNNGGYMLGGSLGFSVPFTGGSWFLGAGYRRQSAKEIHSTQEYDYWLGGYYLTEEKVSVTYDLVFVYSGFVFP